MKLRFALPGLVVAGLFILAASSADAFELFRNRGFGGGFGGGSCCEPACCEPACCEPAPCCDDCCAPRRGGWLRGLFNRHNDCCAVETSCCAPEPSCCAPAPVCEPACCEPAPCCDDCCAPRRGLLHRLFHHCCGGGCGGCEAACGCAAEPSCCY